MLEMLFGNFHVGALLFIIHSSACLFKATTANLFDLQIVYE